MEKILKDVLKEKIISIEKKHVYGCFTQDHIIRLIDNLEIFIHEDFHELFYVIILKKNNKKLNLAFISSFIDYYAQQVKLYPHEYKENNDFKKHMKIFAKWLLEENILEIFETLKEEIAESYKAGTISFEFNSQTLNVL